MSTIFHPPSLSGIMEPRQSDSGLPGIRLCPILRCNRLFADQQSLLQHLYECEHLPAGQFFCHDCQRIESFTDGKRRRSLVHPSRRVRFKSMAKTFFSSLGIKSPPSPNPASCCNPLAASAHTAGPATFRRPLNRDTRPGSPTHPPPSISPSTEHDLSNQPTLPWPGPDYGQAYPSPVELESDIEPLAYTLDWDAVTSDLVARHDMPMGLEERYTLPSPIATSTPSGTSANIQSDSADGIERSGSVRSVSTIASTATTATTASTGTTATTATTATSISNRSDLSTMTSNFSDAWSVASCCSPGSSNNAVSYPHNSPQQHQQSRPDGDNLVPEQDQSHPHCIANTTVATPQPALSDATTAHCSAATFQLDVASRQPFYIDHISSLADIYSFPWPDYPALEHPPHPFACPPAIANADPAPLGSIPDDMYVALLSLTPPIPTPPPAVTALDLHGCCATAKSLVGTVWDVMQAHIASSRIKLAQVPNNPLAAQLCRLSPHGIASSGLSAFASSSAANPLELLCFVHTAYAVSFVMDEERTSERSTHLYDHILAYGALFAHDVQMASAFAQVVDTIWFSESSPTTQSRLAICPLLLSRPSRLIDLDLPCRRVDRDENEPDPLVLVLECFLDEIDYSVCQDIDRRNARYGASDLVNKHLWDIAEDAFSTHTVSLDAVVNELYRKFDTEPHLIATIRSLVKTKAVPSVRRIELTLLQAGKLCLPWPRFFEEYAPFVRRQCSELYRQRGYGVMARSSYYAKGVKLVESIIIDMVRTLDCPPTQHDHQPQARPTSVPYPSPISPAVPKNDGLVMMDLDEIMLPSPYLPDGLNAVDVAPRIFSGNEPSPPEMPDSQPPHSALQFDRPMGAHVLPADYLTAPPTPLPIPLPPPPPSNPPPLPSVLQVPPPLPQPPPPTTPPNGPQNYQCQDCGKRFKSMPKWIKRTLKRHYDHVHFIGPLMRFTCHMPGCIRGYNRKDNLVKHWREDHHLVDGEGVGGGGRRPTKRRKVSTAKS